MYESDQSTHLAGKRVTINHLMRLNDERAAVRRINSPSTSG